MSPEGVAFTKAHGTGNDFIILADLDGRLDVSEPLVRALCHRRTGIGADGVLIVARTEGHPEVGPQADDAPYFMDYRNGDGSRAEMCGNGARVFADHLVTTGLVERAAFSIATRGGARAVRFLDDTRIAVDMGAAQFLDRDDIRVRTADAPADEHSAVGVLMPNPHAVAFVDDVRVAGALAQAPQVTPAAAYPEGANVEFVHQLDDHHIRMRVFERGVGETLSCGTGACAAAVASARLSGWGADGDPIRVDVPGGTVTVTWRADDSVELAGPTQVVAHGMIDRDWWDAHV
jgi:diaminopimelate epimerase